MGIIFDFQAPCSRYVGTNSKGVGGNICPIEFLLSLAWKCERPGEKKVRWTLLHTSIPEVNIFTGDVHNIFSQIAWNTDSAMHFTYHKKDRIENREKRGSIYCTAAILNFYWLKKGFLKKCVHCKNYNPHAQPPTNFFVEDFVCEVHVKNCM